MKDTLIIYESVDRLCWKCHGSGDWSELNRIIEGIDLDDIELSILLAWLTSTLPAKGNLPARKRLVEHIKMTHSYEMWQGLD